MRTPLGPTQCVRNIEVSVFWRLPVIFLVGVAISIRAPDGSFYGSGYAKAGCGLLQRLLMPSQWLNTVACNFELSDLAVRVSILAE